jgi:hypothetical protein
MENERKSWEQMVDEGESDLWFGRFRAYLLMGFKRSVQAVFQLEAEENRGNQRAEAHGYWYEYAKQYDWAKRAQAYDAHWIEEQDKLIAQEREVVLRTGFAVQHRRIQSLDNLLNKLIEMTEDENKIWIPDVKSIGAGPKAYAADIVHFNAPLFTLIEKYKASIAAEMGERVKKQELTGKDGGAMEFDIELVGNRPEDEESEG